MDKSHPTGSGSLSVGRKSGSTVGYGSVALGSGSAQATESNSFAFGYDAEAVARHAVAMGYDCSAVGMYSFALGNNVSAQGRSSHAEGEISVASGDYSHAEGYYSLARGDYQHVAGKFNLEDTTSAEIIGNGTSNIDRSNARTLDWNGNETLAGNLTIGGTPTNANHAARKQDVDAKQDQLTAGDGIDITSNVISADVTNAVMNQAIKDAIFSILPKKTVSGAVASFSDAQGGYPLVNLEASIVPIQAGSGDPSPSNPRAISGFTSGTFTQTGKNLLKQPYILPAGTYDSVALSYDSDFVIHLTGTGGSSAERFLTDEFTLPEGTYKLTTAQSADRTRVYFYKNGTYISRSNTDSPYTFTSAKGDIFKISLLILSSAYSDATVKLMIELGSTATAYERYNATTETVQFGQTVYGGTWKASEGKVVDGYKKKTLSELEWVYQPEQNRFYSLSIQDEIVYPATIYIASDSYCDKLKVVARNDLAEKTICVSTGGQVFIMDTDFTTTEALIQNLGSAEFIYPLATPIEISVDAVNLTAQDGVNNIFSNTGDTSVTYGAKITS